MLQAPRRQAIPRRERPIAGRHALYAYTHAAHEGGFDLGTFPAVRAWLDHVASEPGHVAIDA
jgi:glutathione S-transferase